MTKFDAIIIGSGQGGSPLAKKLAKAGWETVIIEKDQVGGTCINTGCTPSKTMISSAKTAHIVANAAEWGVEVKEFSINLKAIHGRMNKVVEMFRNSTTKGLTQTPHLTLIKGEASFIKEKQIEIRLPGGGKQVVTAEHIFINTGVTSFIPKIEGLENTPYYTSTSLLDLNEIPGHLLIIGSGYIGLEFGQLYSRLKSQVTIIESGKKILKKEDEDVSSEIQHFLEAEGISIRTNSKVLRAEKQKDSILLIVESGGRQEIISGSHLLIAAGRRPDNTNLRLSAAGIETDEKGFIKVNEKLQTTADGVYALGDVNGGPQFTHIAYNDHIILWNNLLKNNERTTNQRLVPYCMFTDPQLGRVGITESEAKEKGIPHKIAILPGKYVTRGIETNNTTGLMKAVINTENDQLLGAAILGEEGGEVMTILQMAMEGNITWPRLREMIFAHPLYAESINNLFMQFD